MFIHRNAVVQSLGVERVEAREDEGVREVFPHIGPIPKVIHLKLFLDHPYPKGIR